MIGTIAQDQAVRSGAEDLSGFDRLAAAHKRWKAGRATAAEIAYLEVTPQAHIDAALEYRRQMRRDDLRRRRDILRHGQRATIFYAALGALPQPPALTRAPRRSGGSGGRPGATRSRARRTATARDDGDPPGESPPAAPRLTLAPRPKAVLTYACLTSEQRGEGS
jgi:hypothetical protein